MVRIERVKALVLCIPVFRCSSAALHPAGPRTAGRTWPARASGTRTTAWSTVTAPRMPTLESRYAPGERPTDLRSFYPQLSESDGPHGGRFHYVSDMVIGIAAAVLIIACPCAMGLATPAAIMASAMRSLTEPPG